MQLNLFRIKEVKPVKKLSAVPTTPAYYCSVCGGGNCTEDDCIREAVERTVDSGPELSDAQMRINRRLYQDWRDIASPDWLSPGR